MAIKIQNDAFDVGKEVSDFSAAQPDAGAVVTFTGLVRNDGQDLQHLLIEHYPAMTGPAIAKIVEQAKQRWALTDCLVIHRFGQLAPGEPIMMVATAAVHRAEAFAAADFLMDYLKSRAPFWKKEIRATSQTWVSADIKDEAALDRWKPD